MTDGLWEAPGWPPAISDCCQHCLRERHACKHVSIPIRDDGREAWRGRPSGPRQSKAKRPPGFLQSALLTPMLHSKQPLEEGWRWTWWSGLRERKDPGSRFWPWRLPASSQPTAKSPARGKPHAVHKHPPWRASWKNLQLLKMTLGELSSTPASLNSTLGGEVGLLRVKEAMILSVGS